MSDGSWDLIASAFQGAVQTHGTDKCAGRPCVIHNPSDHPLKNAPIHFRPDRMYHAERICAHMVPHPDPDSVAYFAERLPGLLLLAAHECCTSRCCERTKE